MVAAIASVRTSFTDPPKARSDQPVTYLYLSIGVVAGILSGLFGIGGGIVIVPALMILAKFPAIKATGSSLGALMLPVGAFIGAMTYYKNGNLDVRASVFIALGMIAGAYLGSQLVQHVTDVQLRRAFAVFLAIVSVKVWMG
jgi:uncharacterized membrane protein YfcA